MLSYKSSVVYYPGAGENRYCDNYYFNSKVITGENDGSKMKLSQKTAKPGRQMFGISSGSYGDDVSKEAVYASFAKLKKYHAFYIKNGDTDVTKLFKNFFREASLDVQQAVDEDLVNDTRISAAVLATDDDTVTVANVGNVKIFSVKNGAVKELTTEHTQAKKMVDMGIIPGGKLRNHPQRRKLVRYLGMNRDAAAAEVTTVAASEGEVFFVLGASFCDLVEDEVLVEAASECSEPGDIAAYVLSAYQNEVAGDFSVIVVKAYSEESAAASAKAAEESEKKAAAAAMAAEIVAAGARGAARPRTDIETAGAASAGERLEVSFDDSGDKESGAPAGDGEGAASAAKAAAGGTEPGGDRDDERTPDDGSEERRKPGAAIIGGINKLLRNDKNPQEPQNPEDEVITFMPMGLDLGGNTSASAKDTGPADVPDEQPSDPFGTPSAPAAPSGASETSGEFGLDLSGGPEDTDAGDPIRNYELENGPDPFENDRGAYDGDGEDGDLGGEDENGEDGFKGAFRRFIGLDSADDGGKDSVWPTVVIFAVCLIILVILVFFVVEMFKKPRENNPSVTPTQGGQVAETSTPGGSETALPTEGTDVTPTAGETEQPTGGEPTETAAEPTEQDTGAGTTPRPTNPPDETEATPTPTGTPTPTPTGEETPTSTDEETPTPTDEETPTPTGEETPTPTDDETPTDEETETPSGDESETPGGDESESPSETGSETSTGEQPTDSGEGSSDNNTEGSSGE